ncbi:MAG TPA: GNAT family N-acetyltransferase [Bryobacteraceae bacterium]|nr:GNAT family N-acetyltransferase [Bryobacteraceae bacterium]
MITPFDVQQAEALSTEAGWNQTRQDWQRLIDLAPDGCFGASADGKLVSTTVALVYGKPLAWIGMVLTTESQRGKGYARNLLRQALDYVDAAGVTCTKLDATDQGRPVYAKLGFIDERPVARWHRDPSPSQAQAPPTEKTIDFQLDREAFGVDRSKLLRDLAQHQIYSIPGKGFALARPGRHAWHFGPCVARAGATAEALLMAFLARHGEEPSVLDFCEDNDDAMRIAAGAGYQPRRRLIRMYRGDKRGIPLAASPLIYAMAGFEAG